MKGNAEIHTGNKKFREGWDEIKKACGCVMGEKCKCAENKAKLGLYHKEWPLVLDDFPCPAMVDEIIGLSPK